MKTARRVLVGFRTAVASASAGAFDLVYVNDTDDPQKMAKK